MVRVWCVCGVCECARVVCVVCARVCACVVCVCVAVHVCGCGNDWRWACCFDLLTVTGHIHDHVQNKPPHQA